MPELYGENATKVTSAAAAANRRMAGVATPAEIVTKFRLGGVILASRTSDDPTEATNTTTNIASAAQVRTLDAGLQSAAAKLPDGAPLLIGTDQEYGVVTRLRSGVVQLPSAMALGAAHDPSLTRSAWAAAGNDLGSVGLTADFAPDADVLADRREHGDRRRGRSAALRLTFPRRSAPPCPGCEARASPPRSSTSRAMATPM